MTIPESHTNKKIVRAEQMASKAKIRQGRLPSQNLKKVNKMTQTAKTTVEIINDILGPVYNKFGFENDAWVKDHILGLLENPEKRNNHWDDEDEPSEAAEAIRAVLWSRYSSGTVSAASTSKLFMELGRESELAWLPKEGRLVK